MELNILCIDDQRDAVISSFYDMLEMFGQVFTIEDDLFKFSMPFYGEDILEVVVQISTHFTPKKAIDQISPDAKFDLVLVDDHWGDDKPTAGQEIFPLVLECIKSDYLTDLPICALFTYHWNQPNRVTAFCQLMSRSADKRRIITGLSKKDHPGLLVLIQSVAIVKRMAQEKARTKVETLARSKSMFVNALRTKLFGNDSIVNELATLIEPFEQWLTGEYEEIPEELGLRSDFPTAILLEGEPGAGKTTICSAIAAGLNSVDAVLPKTLGPGSSPKAWEQKLSAFITTNYKLATKNKVVVIRADDLAWPSPSGITEKGLSADWEQYLRTIRDCLADAALINDGKLPETFAKEAKVGKVEGKILWLFARNEAEDVGEMFPPLRMFLRGPFIISFPRTFDSRVEILERKAITKRITFEPDALNLAVKNTMTYNGRDLVGDDTSVKGFLPTVISRVKARELERWRLTKDKGSLRMIITVAEVNDWLNSNEHKGIVSKSGGNLTITPNINLNVDRVKLGRAEAKMENWELACNELINSKIVEYARDITRQQLSTKVSTKNGTGCSESQITQDLNDYGEIMKTLATTDRWPTLKEASQLFNQPKKNRKSSPKVDND